MTSPIHPFERRGLGLAPFRCTGSYTSTYQACQGAPIQPGSTCDYCGTGIMTVFTIRASDRKEFKVGCDCVAQTYRECAGTDLERDARRVVDQVNKLKTAAANARKDVTIAAALVKLEANRESLSGMTLNDERRDRNALERLEWLFAHAGRTGKIKAAKQLDGLLLAIDRYRAAISDDAIRHENDGRYSKIRLQDFVP